MAEHATPSTLATSPKQTATMRLALVGIVVPAILTVAALAAQLAWLRETPDPLAVHWSGSTPDGSGPAWIYPLLTLLLGFGLSGWLWATALPRMRRGARGWSFRFLAAMALGMSVFGTVSMSWAVRIQVGLDSWQQAPSIGPGLLVSCGLGLAAGFIGWYVQPKQHLTFEALPEAHVQLADGERAVWLGFAKAGKGSVIAISTAVVLLIAGAVAAWVAAEFSVMWILLGLAVLIGLLGLTTMEADVRVDTEGVEVRGPAGWPRSHVPLAEVATASAIIVEPLGSFGGWGWRRVPGAMGVVLRSGEALRVERIEGPALVVTVDDAATAAALLTTLAGRRGA